MSDSSSPTAYVYFIQAGNDPAVKIGSTIHTLAERLVGLQTSNHRELHLLGAIDVGIGLEGANRNRTEYGRIAMRLEREIQRQFARDRIRGEWFNLTNDLLEFIKLRSNVD